MDEDKNNYYPALISSVADTFTHQIDGQFTGKDVVDELLIIIKSVDRLLASTLAQSLLDQKFFISDSSFQDDVLTFYRLSPDIESPISVSGVFTKLTKCFSPTCSDSSTCYSPSCPQRLRSHIHIRREILGPAPRGRLLSVVDEDPIPARPEIEIDTSNIDTTSWDATVPAEVLENLSEDERKRQTFIFELVNSEREFAHDLLYIRKAWLKPLQNIPIIPLSHRSEFLQKTFQNISDVTHTSITLASALRRRSDAYFVVYNIGDIFLNLMPNLQNLVSYRASIVDAEITLERELHDNEVLRKFMEEITNSPDSHQMNLGNWLAKPIARLGQYFVLFAGLLAVTDEENKDAIDILIVLAKLNEMTASLRVHHDQDLGKKHEDEGESLAHQSDN